MKSEYEQWRDELERGPKMDWLSGSFWWCVVALFVASAFWYWGTA